MSGKRISKIKSSEIKSGFPRALTIWNEARSRLTLCVHLLCLALLVTSTLLPAPASAQGPAHDPAPNPDATVTPTVVVPEGVDFMPGELLIGIDRTQTGGDAMATVERAVRAQSASAGNAKAPAVAEGVHLLNRIDLAASSDEVSAASASDIEGWSVRVAAGSELAVAEALQSDPAVIFAEPNYIVRAAALPVTSPDNLPIDLPTELTPFRVKETMYEARQWDMQRIRVSRALALLHVLDPADEYTESVRIAVIDSGIDYYHDDLNGRVLTGKNYVDPTQAAYDDAGHGTHVAGLIGAALDERGMAGVAQRIEIDPYKVLDSRGNGSIADLAQAIRDAANNGAQIINLSLSTDLESFVLRSALSYAHNKGVLLIAASGNAGRYLGWPARHPDVMAVGAIDYDNNYASYSNYGSEVEIAAPGGTSGDWPIFSIWSRYARTTGGVHTCTTTYITVDRNGYCAQWGTSMAAALVSGVAALVWTVRPDLTADEVRTILIESARPLVEPANRVGAGRVDAYAALRRALPSTLLVNSAELTRTLSSTTNNEQLNITIENPSLEPLDWTLTIPAGISWLAASNEITSTVPVTPPGSTIPASTATITGSVELSGTVRFGEPAHVALAIEDGLTNGLYLSTLPLVGTRRDGSVVERPLALQLALNTSNESVYLPVISSAGTAVPTTNPLTPFRWEEAPDGARSELNLTDSSSSYLTLPFTFPMKGSANTSARLYSDGFMLLPGSETVSSSAGAVASGCLPVGDTPARAIYGWRANLDPGVSGGRVTTFAPAIDRFVIEFDNVADASGSYRVSFQIVLHNSGEIGFNYRDAPSEAALLAAQETQLASNVLVAAEAADGRFYNQIGCFGNGGKLGALPTPQSSVLLAADDLF